MSSLPMSTVAVGSSKRRTFGRSRTAHAMRTRCISPPERTSSRFGRTALPRPTAASESSKPAPLLKPRKSRTVIGTSVTTKFCGTYPIRTGPDQLTVPVCGTSPRRTRKRVVFPAPFGPTIASVVPLRTWKLMPSKIGTWSNRTPRLETRRTSASVPVSRFGPLDGAGSVILAVIYERGNPRADLAMLQHRFDEIRTMLHTHVDEADCLQIFVAEGSTARLKELIAQLRRIKGVKVIKFIQTAARR